MKSQRCWSVLVVLAIGPVVCLADGDKPQSSQASATFPALKYAFELSSGPQRAVRVTLQVETPDAAESYFSVQPHWGGEEHVEREVTEPQAFGAAGKALELSVDAASPNRWQVRHAPHEVVRFTYLIAPPGDRLEKETNQYRPILTDSLFHFIGEVGLIAPAWLSEERDVVPIELEWRGFEEAGWKVVSSLGVGAAPRSVRMTVSDFRHSLFMAGKIRVLERKSGPGTVAVGIFGGDWKFDDAEFADLVVRIVQAEREFFNDFEDPYFLVSLIPTHDQGSQSFSLGGTGLTDCFALFCSPNMSLEVGSPRRLRTLHLLAHEYFHTWNGRKISQEEPGELTYWFSEGFTDFYAARLLYNAGLITPEQWIETVSEDLAAYFISPVRTASAEKIRAEFWKDRDVQQLPYKRGSAVALVIDWEMRKRSDGRRGLNDFMRETLALSRERGEKVSNDRLFQRIAAWTSADFAAAMRGVVEEGKLLDLPADLFSPALKIEMREQATYAPGFDVTASVRDKRATGVQAGGAAATAGLRDGMQIVGMSIYGGDPNRLIELTVRDGENTQQIKFMPRGPSVTMPVLQLVSPPKF